ncbi:MAG: type II secretion system protein GspD [Deltaproteobacteria bacterium]|nr:type II secretion system protein GspD [Deltaproteobacteria bacterium]
MGKNGFSAAVLVAALGLCSVAFAQVLPPDPGGGPESPPSGIGAGGPPAGVVPRDGKAAPREFAPQVAPAGAESGGAVTGEGAAPAGEVPRNVVEATAPANVIKVNPSGVSEIPCQKLGLNDMVALDFKDMPLDDLIRLISCWTDKNFLLTGGFQGKTITLMSPQPVTVAEAYKAFLSVLRAHQLIVAPSGKFLRIVPENTGKQETIPFLKDGSGVPADEGMVTKVVKLKYVPASELSQVLGSFKGRAGEIISYGEDTLIITDAAVMVRKLEKFVDELDRPTDKEKIWVRPVQYAEAAQLVEVITGMFGEGAAGPAPGGRPRAAAQPRPPRGQPSAPSGPSSVDKEGAEAIKVSKIFADERTNQLLIVCNSTTYLQVDRLVRKVDVPIPGEGQIHIYYLENADAEELASTLSSLASGTAAGGGARGGGGPRGGPRGGPAGAPGGGVAGLFEGEVKVTAHKQTNSLIIESSLKDFESMKRVVEKLDIRRKQVYVEAMIMEISSNKERKFGISGSAGTTVDVDGETVPLLMGLGGLGVSGLDMQQLMKGGLATGMQGPLVDLSTGSTGTAEGLSGDLSIPSFGFLLQAIASNSDVNILSTPHILTLDNEEAEIQVGKQIPYQATSMGGLGGLGGMGGLGGLGGYGGMTGGRDITSGISSALGGYGGGYGLMSSLLGGGMGMVQRIDVDLTLKITPHINESNFVRLEIDQSVDDVESIDRNLGPTTSKRKVTNTVVVRDQQPVVIGGLIRDRESEGVDKVPFLGDVPLLGIFFRKTVTKTEKKNLLMIIIPHIIVDPSDLSRIHRERLEEIRRFAEYLATKEKERQGMVDYEKKHGALEQMRQVVDRAKAERESRERAEFEGTSVDLVGPPETHDLEYDPTQQPKGDQ